jgi:membrane fusion protein (multidrug efflux system)
MDAVVDTRSLETLKVKSRINWRRLLGRLLMLLGAIALVAGGLEFWLAGGRYVSTDDAYVAADKLMVSTDVSGLVLEVEVTEGESVKKGDVLFKLDPKPFEIALANTRSALAQSELTIRSMEQDYKRMLSDIEAQRAQVQLNQTSYDRQLGLIKIGGTAQQNVDQAKATLETSKAQVEALQRQADVQLAKLGGAIGSPLESHPEYLQARAARDEAQRQLDHTVVRAPFEGVVTQVASLQPGAMIVSSLAAFVPTSAVGLVSNGKKWIQANLKETDLTYVHPGQKVKITVDSYPGRVWEGSVIAIAPATDSTFSVLPQQNSSANWVKVVQRLPVRIAFDPGEDTEMVRAGMSVTVAIDTGHVRKLDDLY